MFMCVYMSSGDLCVYAYCVHLCVYVLCSELSNIKKEAHYPKNQEDKLEPMV